MTTHHRSFAITPLRCHDIVVPVEQRTWDRGVVMEALLYLQAMGHKVNAVSIGSLKRHSVVIEQELRVFFEGRLPVEILDWRSLLKAVEDYKTKDPYFFSNFEYLSQRTFAYGRNMNPFKLLRLLRELGRNGIHSPDELTNKNNAPQIRKAFKAMFGSTREVQTIFRLISQHFGSPEKAFRLTQIQKAKE